MAALWIGLHLLLESPIGDAVLWLLVLLLMGVPVAIATSPALRQKATRVTYAAVVLATLAAVVIAAVLCVRYNGAPESHPSTKKLEPGVVRLDAGAFTPVRVLYGDTSAGLVSEPSNPSFVVRDRVDMTPLLTSTSFRSRVAQWYWGYSLASLPVYGALQYPSLGASSSTSELLPVFVMIHGNALPDLRSFEGYEPLLANLASHGVIALSLGIEYLGTGLVDFIEATLAGGLTTANSRDYAMRAAMAFKHLQVLKTWNETVGHPLFGRVGTRVVVGGHSRGGHAAATAAAWASSKTELPSALALPSGFKVVGALLVAPVFVNESVYPSETARAPVPQDMSLCLLQGLMDSDTGIVSVPHFSNVEIPTVVGFRVASLFVRDVLLPPDNTTARVQKLMERANISSVGTWVWDNGRRVFNANADEIDANMFADWDEVRSLDLSVFKTADVEINDFYRLGRRLIALQSKDRTRRPRIQLSVSPAATFSSIHVQLLQDDATSPRASMKATIVSEAAGASTSTTSIFELQSLTTVTMMRDIGAQHLRVLHTYALSVPSDSSTANITLEVVRPTAGNNELVLLLGDVFVV
ncbi:hypothetical protein ATCC90586_010407 [Pythium insidiosum]|nr:hypothetical protein ATCC90586_010407 [Pythium insidiosum]